MKTISKFAATAALLAPMAVMAGGPTVYGKVHLSTDLIDDGDNTDLNLSSNRSRLGVKGSEDVGNGLTVGYRYEWEVDVADKSTRDLGVRNRYLTLSGGFGTALLGTHDVPFKTTGRKADLFADRVGDLRNVTFYDARQGNVIAYITPDLSGLKFTAAYITDMDKDYADDNSQDAYDLNLAFRMGKMLWMALDYMSIDGDVFTAQEDADSWRFATVMKFGDAKITAHYSDYSDYNGSKDDDRSSWSLGLAYKIGSGAVKFQYAANDLDGDIYDNDADEFDVDAKMWTVGYDHSLSKRTKLYALYSVMNDSLDENPWSGGHGVSTTNKDEDTSALSLGVIHKF